MMKYDDEPMREGKISALKELIKSMMKMHYEHGEAHESPAHEMKEDLKPGMSAEGALESGEEEAFEDSNIDQCEPESDEVEPEGEHDELKSFMKGFSFPKKSIKIERK